MKPRILVVNDEPIIADNLRLTLEREGYEVETALSTVTAMHRMEEREFSVAKPFDSEEMLSLVGKALERRRLVAETSELRRKLAEQSGYGRMLGSSPAMRRVFEMLDSVAGSDANVLIVGESGTGKELAANAVHAQSPRVDGPLVKINCE